MLALMPWRILPSTWTRGHQVDTLWNEDTGQHVMKRLRCSLEGGIRLHYRAHGPKGEPLGPWRLTAREAKADLAAAPHRLAAAPHRLGG